MTKKRKTKFDSLSTPGVRQDLSNYLVELAFLKNNRGMKLPPKFWQQTRYKFKYRREIMACRKFIKKFGEPSVLRIAIDNHVTTWTDYAKVEFLLQQLIEKRERKLATKDTSLVQKDFTHSTIDLRENVKSRPEKKGLFDKLQELEK